MSSQPNGEAFVALVVDQEHAGALAEKRLGCSVIRDTQPTDKGLQKAPAVQCITQCVAVVDCQKLQQGPETRYGNNHEQPVENAVRPDLEECTHDLEYRVIKQCSQQQGRSQVDDEVQQGRHN